MKIKVFIENFINNVKQIKKDIVNRKNFLIDIKREIVNPNSAFNIFNLNIDEEYKKISTFIKLPPEMQIKENDASKYKYLKDYSRQITLYIGTDLNWGEYFLAPNFYYIEDEDDTENISCTYLAVWEYKPVILENKNFWVLFSSLILCNLAIITIGILLLIL